LFAEFYVYIRINSDRDFRVLLSFCFAENNFIAAYFDCIFRICGSFMTALGIFN